MSRKDSTGSRRRTAFGLATAAGGALAAAMLSMGTAPADPSPTSCPTTTGTRSCSGPPAHRASSPRRVSLTRPGHRVVRAKTRAMRHFDHGRRHVRRQLTVTRSEDLINAIDPSAFVTQTDTRHRWHPRAGGGHTWSPTTSLATLATGLDFFLLDPTGLDYLLTPGRRPPVGVASVLSLISASG